MALPFFPYRNPKILDSVDGVPKLLQAKGIKSALLVTDKSLRTSGAMARPEELLSQNDIYCGVYDDTRTNPTVDNVEAAKKLYFAAGCQALIAFEGGSSMDCTKAVGARLVYPKKHMGQLKGLLRALRKIPPLVAILTTVGTGSEATVTAVITDSDTKHKYTILEKRLGWIFPCVTSPITGNSMENYCICF